MMKIYAIPNCDTVKKARKWLEAEGLEYEFHDYKKLGTDDAVLRAAIDRHGLDVVLNKRGRKWKMLEEAEQAQAESLDGAIALMGEYPSIIKRPILVQGDMILVGFKDADYAEHLK